MAHPARKAQVLTEQRHGAPTPRASIDDKEKLHNRHARVDSMFTPNTPTNTVLTRRDTPTNRFHQEAVEAEDIYEADEEIPPRDDGPSSTVPSVASPPLTDAYLERMERLITLQERAARIQPPPGHTYGILRVTGNARAVRGNAFNTRNPEARILARRHQYGDAQAENGGLIDGDVDIDDLDDIFGGKKDPDHHGDQGRR